jgi:hypothetical protein
MARSRTPKAKAEVSGAALHDPQRFRDRKRPHNTRSLGEPYARMTDSEKEAWEELDCECPWLHSAHRPIVKLACVLMGKLADGSTNISDINGLSAILSKLGATPSDESRIAHDDGGGDEDDEFFRPH